MEKVHLVSLGCAKNRVDSEVMIGILQGREYELIEEPDDADVQKAEGPETKEETGAT